MSLVSQPDDGFNGGVSKVYGPAKRRKASVNRRFPMGCGRNAAITRIESHLKPPTAGVGAANNGDLASLKEPNGEQRPPSTQIGGTGLSGQVQTAKTEETVQEHNPERSKGLAQQAQGHGMEEDDPSKQANLGNPVNKEMDEPNGTGHSEMDSERAEHGLGYQKSTPLMPADGILDGGISKLFGPAKKRRVSTTRRFQPGSGRTTAAVGKEEPEGAQDGDPEKVVGRSEGSLPSIERHVKENPKEAKGEDSKMELQTKSGVSLGNQESQCSIKRKNKLPAVRHFPVGAGRDAGKVREGCHGGQARGGGLGRGDDAAESIPQSASKYGSAMAALGRPQFDAKKAPLMLSRGEKEGKASEDAMANSELRADRIVLALMASTKCPRSRRRRSAK